MRGSAPERSCGQGVPRVNRVVQARVVLDAIVSNKTFWNATSAPACFQLFSSNFLCKLCGTFKTIEQDVRSFVSTGTMNEVMANRSRCLSEWRSSNIFSLHFLTEAFARGRVVVS